LTLGDELAGPARKPRRGERHPALVHVDSVNGAEPSEEARRSFEDLTAVSPTRRLELGSPSTGSDEADALIRAVDLLSPLALGQRVLVLASARSGRTTLLRGLAKSLAGRDVDSKQPLAVVVALIDERPEEATRWRELVPEAELALATADMSPGEQVALVELALARAKRLVESGTDVVLLVDSLSRLEVANDDPAPAKRLFGSGRETSEDDAGSLTVIATMLEGADGDGAALRSVRTTESAVIRLDPELAASGIVPALDPSETRAIDESDLRDSKELKAVKELRERLAGKDTDEAARDLAELISGSVDNQKLLKSL